jgi:ribonucleoside-diphosphate reductase alpha chain
MASSDASATLSGTQAPGAAAHSAAERTALEIRPTFCPVDVDSPFDTTEWELRTAAIKGEDGKVLFEQPACEIPAAWSQLATNVVVSKYFYGEIHTPEREHSVKQLVHRVARTIADWGIRDGYFRTKQDGENFYRDLAWLCVHQHGAFNSPVWFNVGLFNQYGVKGAPCNWRWDEARRDVVMPENPYEYPQGSACFIQSVKDNMEDIMDLARSEAMLFKFGSGTGTDLSTLRSQREKLAGGGKPSGPLSFMRVYDQVAAVVKSGGKTRRAAKMQSLKVTHPDILEFVECKAKEEKKARILIEKGGYDSNFNGEAYSSILFQNANLSVRVTDDFMEAVDRDDTWTTRWVTEPSKAGPSYKARDLLGRMSECAWQCGDPGVQYDTTINRWHTCPNSGRINASNPCSEYMFLDDTACNLASVNLMKFRRPDGVFDVERFAAACRIFFVAQEILVDHASYPTPRIARNSHLYRPLGLGYSNLGSLLMADGLAYDSDAGRGLCGALTAILHGTANRTSAELAAAVGPFEGFAANREPMLGVMQMHRDAVEKIDPSCPKYLHDAARRVWDEVLAGGRRHGYRNAQATVLAPTGTISFLMDCDTTGIEPDIALVKYKQLAGGGMLKIVNQTVPLALRTLGYDEPAVEGILAYRGRTRAQGPAPAGLRLRVQAAAGPAEHRLAGPREDDGRGAAVHLRRHLQDREHAAGDHARRHRRCLPGGLADGPEGPGDLPRRLEGKPAPQHRHRDRQGRGQGGRRPAAGAVARHAAERHAQVQRRWPRGLHHRRAVRRRAAGRIVHHHGQGGEHDRRPDGRLRHGRVDEPAVRRAAGGVREEVLAHPVRALGLHEESGHPRRQEPRRLHLPLDGHGVHPRLSRGEPAGGLWRRRGGRRGGRC